jgi:hypothetical protein
MLLSGAWTVAVEAQVFGDPESVKLSGRDPLKPSAPPTALLSEDRWHIEERTIPGCWEDWGWSKRIEGPVWFFREFSLDVKSPCSIRFDGVSYFCHVWLNATYLGCHRGIWDSFDVLCPDFARTGTNLLAVEVFKPWEHFFPTKSTLAGFIPYVTCTFGGIWKDVSVVERPYLRITDLYAYTDPAEGIIHVQTEIENDAPERTAEVLYRIGESDSSTTIRLHTGTNTVAKTLPAAALETWSPESPAHHQLTVTVAARGSNSTRSTSFGIRLLEPAGRQLRLNGNLTYLRGILHWMGYVDSIPPVWNEQRHTRELEHIEKMGFNLIKMCLVIPPEEYLDLADRIGMMIWIELPMWMPQVDDTFRAQAASEYRAIVRQIRNHPSVVMWTLGCELDANADGEFLAGLFEDVRELTPGSPLLRDNSGSAEAYGGVELDQSDFYDYHFYAEANRLQSLVDHFVPGWKREKPLIFGEYCDSDTLRNVQDWNDPWWVSEDADLNPQGVRWDMSVVDQPARIDSLTLPFPWPESIKLSRRKSAEYRKIIIEQTRADPRIAGYVITNIMDTPLSTAGLLDAAGEPKFDATEMRALNAGILLAMERDKRRIWARGGDRTQLLDRYNVNQESTVRYHIIASCFSEQPLDGVLAIRVGDDSGATIAEATSEVKAEQGQTARIGGITFSVPKRDAPFALTLDAMVESASGTTAGNSWCLWALPISPGWESLDCRFVDPLGPFGEELLPAVGTISAGDETVLVTSRLEDETIRHFREGRRVFVVLDRYTPTYTLARPFWREGVPFVDDSSVFEGLPIGGVAGTQFLGVTPDLALNTDEVNNRVGLQGNSLIRRIDARTLEESSYWMEWADGAGRLTVTTLRLFGESGFGPTGADCNILGAYLLRSAIAAWCFGGPQ